MLKSALAGTQVYPSCFAVELQLHPVIDWRLIKPSINSVGSNEPPDSNWKHKETGGEHRDTLAREVYPH